MKNPKKDEKKRKVALSQVKPLRSAYVVFVPVVYVVMLQA